MRAGAPERLLKRAQGHCLHVRARRQIERPTFELLTGPCRAVIGGVYTDRGHAEVNRDGRRLVACVILFCTSAFASCA